MFFYASSEELGEMDVFHILHIKVGHTQYVADIDVSRKNHLECRVKGETAFFVEVAQVSLFVIIGHIYQYGTEDSPIAQHVVLRHQTHLIFLGDITAGSNDDGRSPVFMVAQHRQCHCVLSILIVVLTSGTQVDSIILLLAAHNVVDGFYHVLEVFLHILLGHLR